MNVPTYVNIMKMTCLIAITDLDVVVQLVQVLGWNAGASWRIHNTWTGLKIHQVFPLGSVCVTYTDPQLQHLLLSNNNRKNICNVSHLFN